MSGTDPPQQDVGVPLCVAVGYGTRPRRVQLLSLHKNKKNICMNLRKSTDKGALKKSLKKAVYLLQQDTVENPRHVDVDVVLHCLQDVHVSSHTGHKLGGLGDR